MKSRQPQAILLKTGFDGSFGVCFSFCCLVYLLTPNEKIMKNFLKITRFLFTILLSTGLFVGAHAQRGGRAHDGQERAPGRNSGIYQTDRPRITAPRMERGASLPQYRGSFGQTPPNRTIATAKSPRDLARQSILGNAAQQRTFGRYYPGAPGVYKNVYVPQRYVFAGAPRYSVLPYGSLALYYGGYPYYYNYNTGLFFGFYDGFYTPVFAPIGLTVRLSPFGYYPVFAGPGVFYYANGTYYRSYNNQYEVVDAPMGAQISALPQGAKSVEINGEPLYEFNGTYYKEDRDSKGKTVYTVVGKNGKINNTQNQPAPSVSHQLGDVVAQLPEGSKTVTVNGEELFKTPDGTYLKQQFDGRVVTYKAVGLPYVSNDWPPR